MNTDIRVHPTRGVSVAMLGDVQLVLWAVSPRLPLMRWVLDRGAEFVASRSGTVMVMQVIAPSNEAPDRASWTEASQRMGDLLRTVRRFVSVPVGDGVRPILVRSLMRTIAVTTGRQRTMLIEPTVIAGVRRLREAATPDTPSNASLLGIVNHLSTATGAAMGC